MYRSSAHGLICLTRPPIYANFLRLSDFERQDQSKQNDNQVDRTQQSIIPVSFLCERAAKKYDYLARYNGCAAYRAVFFRDPYRTQHGARLVG